MTEKLAVLPQKVIEHKSHDGWRIRKVWKEARSGEEEWRDGLGHLRGGGTNRRGHDFDPKDYRDDKMWVVLTAPIKSS